MWNFGCDIDKILMKAVVNRVQVVHVDSECVQVVHISF